MEVEVKEELEDEYTNHIRTKIIEDDEEEEEQDGDGDGGGEKEEKVKKMEQMFKLDWIHFEETVVDAFNSLLKDTHFTDVTLACEDGQVKAHRVILSNCSDFFNQIFINNPQPRTLIFHASENVKEVSSLMKFILQGRYRWRRMTR